MEVNVGFGLMSWIQRLKTEASIKSEVLARRDDLEIS